MALAGLGEIAVTVTSADGARKLVYRVRPGSGVGEPGTSANCLRGAVAAGFSLLVAGGGSVEDLVACAERRNVTALYALHEGGWLTYIPGAPEFVNRGFVELFAPTSCSAQTAGEIRFVMAPMSALSKVRAPSPDSRTRMRRHILHPMHPPIAAQRWCCCH